MLTRCAWCGNPIGETRSADVDQPISHGICDGCEATFMAQLSVPILEFLASLDAPVMLVSVEEGNRVLAANRQALDATGKTADEVHERLVGEVFECAHANLPEGCGLTVHCSGCAIRTTVETTWRTGEAMNRVPATLRPNTGTAPIVMEISTERVNDRVLLRLDSPPRREADPELD